MKISVLTPTADRPAAFALCEQMVARQTVQPFEWIVADGGETPVRCTRGQVHVHSPSPPGASNFANNLLNGIALARGDLLVIMEDDDAYLPEHLERMATVAQPIVGSEETARYYNVAERCWRELTCTGASLCQTALRRELLPLFRRVVEECLERRVFSIDASLWRAVGRERWGFSRAATVVGMKGMPGSAGLGVGHRPDAQWESDPSLEKLREWIGKDAERYAEFFVGSGKARNGPRVWIPRSRGGVHQTG